MKNFIKRYKGKLIYFLILLVILVTFLVLSTNVEICEFLSRTVNRYYIKIVGSITSLIPFSVFEILFILCICFIIFLIIYIILKRKEKDKVINILLTYILILFTIITSYTCITKPCYNRKELDIPQYEKELSYDEMKTFCLKFVDDLTEISNSLRRDEKGNIDLLSYYSYDELANKLIEEYAKCDSDYISSFTPKSKYIMNSWFLSEMGVTGITMSLTGEANVNNHMPKIDIPNTMAHEIAHTKGIMREDEANLMALYVCLNSDDPILKYSGMFRCYDRVFSLAKYSLNTADYNMLNYRLSNKFKIECNNYYNYFNSHNSLDKIQTFINNIYLKLNGVENGVESYNDPSGSKTNTGTTRDDGSVIYKVVYSKQQKLIMHLYLNN